LCIAAEAHQCGGYDTAAKKREEHKALNTRIEIMPLGAEDDGIAFEEKIL